MKQKRTANLPMLVLIGFIVFIWNIIPEWSYAKVTFANPSATMLLESNNSKLSIYNAAKIQGFSLRSVVKSFGNSANLWHEAYQNGAVIGQLGQTGITVVPPTNLVDANSNAIINTNALGYANSQAMLYLHRVDSNAIVKLSNISTDLITQNSNAIKLLDLEVRAQSNACAYGIKNNSNAIVAAGGDGALSHANSQALLYLHRVDSNAIKALASISNQLIVQNSSAIVRLNRQAQTLFGPEPVIITQSTYVMTTDVYLSDDHLMQIQTGPANCTIDGAGHALDFANGLNNLLQVDPGIVVTLTNVVLRNYRDTAVQLGVGSRLIFGDGVRVELDTDQPLARNWVFAGQTTLAGAGNRLTIDPYSVAVMPNSELLIKETAISGIKSSNIRCSGETSSLVFEASDLYLTNNMTFTSGFLTIDQDVRISGTNIFSYQSDRPLTIDAESRLQLQGIGFEYAPVTANRDLIMLTDRSSILSIDGCTLSSTTTGMRLLRGSLVVDHVNMLFNPGAISLSEGFGFGIGYESDDLDIQIKPGASLELINGMLDYANVN